MMMIHKSDPSDLRRILTFPVVHPCQSISPTTLLHSLISLAHKICDYQSNGNIHHHRFTTQKRNARDTLRHIRNLLIFLEEIRDNNTLVLLPQSINLCFFELHLTFQKILFLLEDCTREGAHLWILMKFKRVSTEFQILIRTISNALDVLPFGSIHLSTEVKELVELISKQAEKAKLEVDLEDETAAVTVLSILNQFETRVSPDLMVLKSVLDHLGIRSWSQCNKEIKFLEEEICLGSGRSNNGDHHHEEKQVVFLKNLLAFMIYSRVVLFDQLDRNIKSNTSDDHLSRLDDDCGEMLSCLNPEDFKCPISLEIMTDPVTLSTGHTYDRVSIEKWFKAGNLICPKTGEKVSSIELLPNWALQKLIRRFCSDNGIPMVSEPGKRSGDMSKKRLVSPSSPVGAAEAALRMLSKFLAGNLAVGTGAERNKAAYEIRLLAKSNIFNMSCLVEAGTIPFLLNLLSSMSPSIQENSMAALLNLSKQENQQSATNNKRLIVENCGLILIMDVLIEGLKIETRQLAASTLFHLSSIEEYRKLIGEIPEAIPTLVGLIKDKTLHPRVKKSAAVAIFGLLLFPGNHRKVLQAGIVPLLVDILVSSEGSSTSDVITESLAVLELIAEKPEGAFAILCTSTALHRFMGVLSSSSTSSQAKEYCVSLLLSLCTNGGSEVVAKLQKASSLMTSLYSLLTHGTSRANKKANAILRILHEFNGPSSSSSRYSAPEVRQDRSVHAW